MFFPIFQPLVYLFMVISETLRTELDFYVFMASIYANKHYRIPKVQS